MNNKHIFEQNRKKNPFKQKDSASNKSELIKKMRSIQKSHENVNQEAENEKSDINYKKLYKEQKKLNEKLKKELSQISEQAKRDREELSEKNNKLKDAKRMQHSLIEEINSLKYGDSALIKEYDEKLTQAHLEIERLNEKLDEEVLKSKQFRTYEKRYKGSLNTINQLKDNLNQMKGTAEHLEERLVEKTKGMKTLESKIHKKDEKIEYYKSFYDNFYENLSMIDPEQMLNDLYERMDESNYSSFKSVFKLVKKYRSLSKFYSFSQTERVNVFGYLKKYEDSYKLESTNGETYQIRIHVEESSDESGKPARGILNDDGTVDIVLTYEDETSFNTDEEAHRVRRKKSTSKENEVEHVHIGNFKVLIISSRDGKKFTDRLRLHGLQVEWMDGFNKLKETKNMMISADVVLACADSASHDIINHVSDQGNDPKYQVLFNPNEDAIIARTIYAKHQLKL
ncbi:hypothetical protein MH122_13515 [Bacillus pumilus]|uniref:hypothetical protein n=1 Tax=Bacillus pumilus TaxID=1408 RepID=UPI0022829455|nr:hypothetical protein [Bacillus pumilus]MCY7679817.1 hypothetical protein [Bacillus pumilus]